jgi:hypothetical protein
MAELLTAIEVAVLNALASDFRGMTRKAIATHASKELDYEVHAKNELERLLPKMQDAGLICKDARTWLITEAGRRAIAEEPQEEAQVICFAYYLLSRSCPDHFSCPGR